MLYYSIIVTTLLHTIFYDCTHSNDILDGKSDYAILIDPIVLVVDDWFIPSIQPFIYCCWFLPIGVSIPMYHPLLNNLFFMLPCPYIPCLYTGQFHGNMSHDRFQWECESFFCVRKPNYPLIGISRKETKKNNSKRIVNIMQYCPLLNTFCCWCCSLANEAKLMGKPIDVHCWSNFRSSPFVSSTPRVSWVSYKYKSSCTSICFICLLSSSIGFFFLIVCLLFFRANLAEFFPFQNMQTRRTYNKSVVASSHTFSHRHSTSSSSSTHFSFG